MPWGVRLSGVVVLQRDGVEVPLTGDKQRVVLAALALSPAVPVPTDRLVELVWGEAVPRSARRTVQSHVASLRSLMRRDGDVPLIADGPGYSLRIERSDVDLLAFEDRVSAVLERADADPSATVSRLSEVLASWEEPLAGVGLSDRMRAVLAPFEELHVQAVEALLVAQIDAGDAGVAVRRLESLVRSDPTREHLWFHLARALDATGRRRDAMRAVQRAREALRQELGVEPGVALRVLERRLLEGQPVGQPADGSAGRRIDLDGPVTHRDAIPGTVSFLFTDLGRSPQLWEEHGASMSDAVALHDGIVRAAIDDAGGFVFSTAGDSVAAAFGSASAAADAAEAIAERLTAVEWPTPEPLRTRIGLHVGEVHRRGDDYFGPTVNRAARIMAAAHPGQILASGAFVALLGPSAEVLDLGEHRLKDLTAAEHLWQLGSGVFPPPVTLGAARHNLPAARTDLLGRSEILVQLVDDVRRTRLLTLAGPGGVGKTRLALALGAEVLADQEGGVWVVDLTSVVDGARVVAAVAEATGVMVGGGEGGVGAVADVLARRGLLLILDNCEHVLDECAELADAILERDGRTKVVATSREPLDVPGELVRRIPPLRSGASGGGVLRGPAVELFVERALAASPATDPSEWDERVVAELCDRLDGMPLGIELAAAQTPHLSPAEIVAQLDDRFVLLAGARRGRRHGHQTLQAVMDWSWDLLTDEEARTLEELAVLVGEWTLEPAARVVGLPVAKATAVVGRLVAKSLVVPASSGEWTTYRLLDTVRLYGLRRLAGAGREEAARERHCAAFHDPLAELSPARKYVDYGLVAIALRDWSNTTVAMDWALARGDAERAAQLLSGTYLVWLGFDGLPPDEGYRRCHTVLESELSPATRAFTTVVASATAYASGRLDETADLAEAAFTLAREVDDPGLLAAAASHIGKIIAVADPVRSLELCELAIDAGIAADEPGVVRLARQGIGILALVRGDVDTAEDVAAQLDDCTDGYDRFATLQLIVNIGLVRGQPERAVKAARAALDIYGRSARGSAFYVNFVLSYVLVAAGADAAAEEPFAIALATQRASGLDVGLPDLLMVEARRAVNRGDVETARVIAGAVRHGGVAGRSTVTMFGLRELRSLVGKLPDPASALSLRDAADRFLPA